MLTTRPMRLVAAALAATCLFLSPATPARAAGARVAIACGALGMELQLCREASERWARRTGNTVSIVNTPNSSNDRFALYLQLLASRSPDIDVLQIDVVWSGMLASHLADLRPTLGASTAGMFPALVKNDTVDGRLVAIPWYMDVGVLYYRQDLLEKYGYAPPKTWEELTRMAATIQRRERLAGNRRLWGYVFQGRAYEGLTCNALEWVASRRGGTFIDEQRRITADNPRAERALGLAAGWIGTITPRGVLNYDEEASRGVFQTGGAVFMRNWPYAWALAQAPDSPVRGKVGVTMLPKGGPDGRNAAALGGWQLAVSRYSRHPREAADLVGYLTSAAVQKERSVRGAYNPTIIALYRDPAVLEANPFYETLLPAFLNATARPARQAGARYNQVSDAVWSAVHEALAGEASPRQALADLSDQLDRIRQRARWR
jgi:trehalose/maltose transport system substrate-binding protein